MPAVQLPLPIRLDAAATFENFYEAGNQRLLSLLCEKREPYVYMWGNAGSGKSHLLQALCHATTNDNQTAIYLPLAAADISSPEILEGLESTAVICIDDLQAIAGRQEWEEGIFHLFNRVRDSRGMLRIAARSSPAAAAINLADLGSRLSWGVTYQLQVLDDAQKIAALQMRAQRRGMELPIDVAQYLIKQVPRDMHSLFSILERMDQHSLQLQRRLTIPFVKEMLYSG